MYCPFSLIGTNVCGKNAAVAEQTWRGLQYLFCLVLRFVPSWWNTAAISCQTPPSCWKRGQSKSDLWGHSPLSNYKWTVKEGPFSYCCFRLQPRTEALLGMLVLKRVASRDALLSVWKTEDKCEDAIRFAGHSDFTLPSWHLYCFFIVFSPTVLLSAYCQWLPEALHQEVAKSWPPVWRLTSKGKKRHTWSES